MLRILRAFAWLRWRMLINALEHTGARDTLERFSLAIEKLGPIMAAVLMIPSGLLLAAGAAASGYALARHDRESLLLEAARYLMIGVPVFAIIGPILLPAADRTNPVRLLLLPISRGTLYAAQSAAAFGDVWVLVILPFVLFLPIGLVAGGAYSTALVALAAGALLVLVVIGISSLTTSLVHLAVRDRRRGELLALLFIVAVPAVSVLPGLLAAGRLGDATATRQTAVESGVRPGRVSVVADRAFQLYPTELYVSAARRAAGGDRPAASARLAALAATVVALHGLGLLTFARVLASPGTTGSRRAAVARTAWGRTLPGLTSGASAVALAQLRLALRTPRGRSILISPIILVAVIGVVLRQRPGGMDLGFLALDGGLSLATFGSFVALISTLPLAMNQFAVDRAGLTLALLSPLTDREYLIGKAVGNTLIAAMASGFCLVASVLTYPGGSPALWLSIPPALVATCLLVAPAAALLSALFPRVVDLNSIGHGSNAHGLAGLLGVAAFAAAGAPGLAIALAASTWLDGGPLVPLLLVVWCGVAYLVSGLLFVPVRRLFALRRENFAMLR